MCKLIRIWQYFATKRYVCRVCGVVSENPNDLCHPVEKDVDA
jgi:hypothetical protein